MTDCVDEQKLRASVQLVTLMQGWPSRQRLSTVRYQGVTAETRPAQGSRQDTPCYLQIKILKARFASPTDPLQTQTPSGVVATLATPFQKPVDAHDNRVQVHETRNNS